MAVSIPSGCPACVHNDKGDALLREARDYDFDLGLFERHTAPRKVFSVAWVENHSIHELNLAQRSRRGCPEFYWTGLRPALAPLAH